jgi:G3E family GTPase
MPPAIPILLLTGALGAGKTTMLRRWLAEPGGARLAVVVNEFAELGIDQLLLGEGTRARTLSNGCFCCRDQGDIATTLNQIFADRRAGTLADFDRVVIEASGLADPGALLMALARERELGLRFALDRVVACVDATRLGAIAAGDEVMLRQIALADVVAITKADLAGADIAVAAEAAVAAINPAATIRQVRAGDFPIGEVLAAAGARTRFVAAAATNHGAIGRVEIVSDQDWEWQPFALAMHLLGELRGPDLLRVKGLVRVAGRAAPVLYQRVGHLAHPPAELPAWPEGRRETRLVFITRGIDGAAIESLIAASLAAGRPPPR